MSILIKGMKMPETCCDCNFNIAGWCVANLDSERIEFPGRPEWCPLVEVPKHGRLADADGLIKDLDGIRDTVLGAAFLAVIEIAPTIVEAEE